MPDDGATPRAGPSRASPTTRNGAKMPRKTITRTATAAAATAIVGLSVTLAAPANAINKPEPNGGNGTPAHPVQQAQLAQPANHSRHLDPAQIAAGALGGVTLAGLGLAATTRRRHNRSTPTPA